MLLKNRVLQHLYLHSLTSTYVVGMMTIDIRIQPNLIMNL